MFELEIIGRNRKRGGSGAGCRGVLIGLESLNSRSLTNAAKRFHEPDKYKEIIDNIHSHGMAVNGCFVLEFDNDAEEELPERLDEIYRQVCKEACTWDSNFPELTKG